MNRNNMPLILMLVAGAATCIITFLGEYTISQRLLILFIALLVFYLFGTVLRLTLNHFDSVNEKRSKAAGEVIEKETETENEEQAGEVKSV
jgi:phosphotransferase system  glucose/maltose/N-acetylglucosamine-specific IIC component